MNMHTVPNLVTIGTGVWHISHIFEFVTTDPLQMPLGLDVLIYLAHVHSLVNLYTCDKFGPGRSRGLEAFTDL